MNNKELAKLLQDFVASQDDINKDDWYSTNREAAKGVVDDFVNYMNRQGVRISLSTKG